MPDKTISSTGCIIEAISSNSLCDSLVSFCQLCEYPTIDCKFNFVRVKIRIDLHPIHLRKAGRIPQLGAKITITGNTRRVELYVTPLRRHDRERKTQGIGAIFVHQFQRINDRSEE